MKKDVILSISGLHAGAPEADSDPDPIEVITPAAYYYKNGKHYVLYDEIQDETKEWSHNKIRISPDKVEIIKGGAVSSQMVFELDKMNLTQYQTPYGHLMIGTLTRQMRIDEEEDKIDVAITYSLDVNDEWAADCNVKISIRSK